MKITFVAIGWEQLAISQLSSIAKMMRHSVGLAFSASLFDDKFHLTVRPVARFFDDTDVVLKTIERQKPDVLVFSAISSTYRWLLYVAEKSKQMFPNVKTVFGGVHVTASSDRVIEQACVDYVCIGEGEEAFVAILNSIDKKDGQTPIINTIFKKDKNVFVRGRQDGFTQDLDKLPIFDKTIWEDYMQFNDSYFTMASRGCPYRCSYCFNSFYTEHLPKGYKYLRHRSAEHVLFELRQAKKRYRLRLIEFFDDCFTMDKNWLKKFLEAYKKEIAVEFQCFTHLKFIDEDVASWMKSAGCRAMQIGVQSFDEEYKRNVLNRNEENYLIERATKILKKYKILPKYDHMFGLPDEPLDAQRKALEHYKKFPPYRIQTYWTNLYPGTKMLEQQFLSGRVSKESYEAFLDGTSFDSFTKENEFIDGNKIKTYKVYEMLFKLLPALPECMRKRLEPSYLLWMPKWLCGFVTLVEDIVIGVFRLDVDIFCYAKFYMYHIFRFFMVKCKGSIKPATKIYDSTFEYCFNEQAVIKSCTGRDMEYER